jgi:N-acetyl-anhydromuramyl-L-alanine amidase AmpD
MSDNLRNLKLSRGNFIKGVAIVGTSLLIGGQELRLIAPAEAAVAAPSIVGINTWGGQQPRGTLQVLNSRPTKILVHHTQYPNSSDTSTSQIYARAREIQLDHFSRGWSDSGQNFLIGRGGHILEGRRGSLSALQSGTRHVVGAHCPGRNSDSVGIENDGSYMSVLPPSAQYSKLVAFCAYICQQYGIASSQIFGHRDFIATDCPGNSFYAKLPQLRSEVAAMLGNGGGTPTRSWPLIKSGNSGETVKTLQYALQYRGFTGVTADGVFGSGTEAAVKSFQSSNGLPADGIVGAQTWEAILPTVRSGDNNPAVKGLQSQLNTEGYSLTVDGDFGTNTLNAVKSFQTAKGLSADGIVGLNTWNALVN